MRANIFSGSSSNRTSRVWKDTHTHVRDEVYIAGLGRNRR